MRRNATAAAALAACMIGVASCGGGSSNGGSSGSSSGGGGTAKSGGGYSTGGSKSTSAPSGGGTVMVKLSKTKLGRILTDGKGRTLYLFEKDKGPKSSCFGACASGWPPLVATGKPTLASGLAAAKLGMTARTGGAKQVTYGGHPLYYFVGDKAPGQTTGEGLKAFGAEWYVLSASGKKVEEGGS
jgi:predicted lipoprotein with Yx(FWY)xxD motif